MTMWSIKSPASNPDISGLRSSRRWRWQPAPKAFGVPDGYRGSRRESAVAQLSTLIWHLRDALSRNARKEDINPEDTWIRDAALDSGERVTLAARVYSAGRVLGFARRRCDSRVGQFRDRR